MRAVPPQPRTADEPSGYTGGQLMFERRLKVFLFFLAMITAVLIGRAVQIQLLNRDKWTKEASESLQEKTFIETTRGNLLDANGRPLATDVASMDACVDYRAITPEPDAPWVRSLATARAVALYGSRPGRARVAEQVQLVKDDIVRMWKELAREEDESDDEMNESRRAIVKRVELSRRYLWYRKKLQVEAKARRVAAAATETSAVTTKPAPTTAPAVEPPPAVRAWLNGDSDIPPSEGFDIKVAEQAEPHVILRAIKPDVYNRLAKHLERYPGLVLRSNLDRTYPQHELASHVVGHLTYVEGKDIESDPYAGDELREYRKNDQIGRSGLEGLCEPLLRGVRGSDSHWTDDAGTHESEVQPVPGVDIRTTLDLGLEQQITDAFKQVPVQRAKEDPKEKLDLYGAAVVLDVASDSVLAMVSLPTFDADRFDELYGKLKDDKLNEPLLNRATSAMLETGSTIKPVVGIGAITQGVMGLNDTIECTGYLVIGGKKFSTGRCWTASRFALLYPDKVTHHQIPIPHPTGFLTFSDALERSCNIFFENMGDRLGLEGLSHWMSVFGLGRATGIGIPEARGRLPNSAPSTLSKDKLNFARWDGGIGQGYVAATPLQMANIAATIARDGVWMRPHLLPQETMRKLAQLSAAVPGERSGYHWADVPERVVLPVAAAAVAAAREGMWRVANSPAGTGRLDRDDGLVAAGKTGTAQAAHFFIPTLDESGRPVRDENGKPLLVELDPSTYQKPNKLAPWYLGFGDKGTDVKHAWYIGYAPADHPRIAFAVLVEYGGSGGTTAQHVANKILDACVERGYLPNVPHVSATTTAAVQ